jgi:hypothetical protein
MDANSIIADSLVHVVKKPLARLSAVYEASSRDSRI